MIGNRTAQLKRLVDRGRLLHSYLFFGEDRDSMREAAFSLAHGLERGVWSPALPPLQDLLVTEKGRNGGIGIEEIRAIADFLWRTPFQSSRRTVIIPEAELLTFPASHALLKIAEEPPPHALLVFLSRDPSALLPTLLSRFQRVYFPSRRKISDSLPFEKEARSFLTSSLRERSLLIRELVAREEKTAPLFLESLLSVLASRLRVRPNAQLAKEILRRLALLRRLQTNPRLQLEAVSAFLSRI